MLNKNFIMLSEGYIKRLKELAGIPIILNEATEQERLDAFAASGSRMPYNKDLMILAIKQGREVGVLFQSNNSKYKMPVAKYRTIYPVAIGTSKAGNPIIRAFHKIGQSESEAIKTGKRSAEVENQWRLMKVSNIKSIWMTVIFFRGPLEKYNPNDKGMIHVEYAANFNEIRKFQDDLVKQQKTKEEQEKQRSKILTIGEKFKKFKNQQKKK